VQTLVSIVATAFFYTNKNGAVRFSKQHMQAQVEALYNLSFEYDIYGQILIMVSCVTCIANLPHKLLASTYLEAVYCTLLEKMAHFSSLVTYGAGRSSQWAKPFVIFSSSG
jgi:hypothetical protein